MKRIQRLLFFIGCFFSGAMLVWAAPTYSFYTGASSIVVGSSVTATLQIKGVAAWNVSIKSSGSTSGCTTSFADATSDAANTTKYLSVTCKATSTGAIGFTVTGDATSQDGSTVSINASRTVNVTTPREKDSNNYLQSIGVTGYTLTPEFNQDTLEYSVEVPATVDKVTIEAAAASGYATVSGTGEFEVNEGVNVFSVTVTSETGVERVYKVNVNVKDENPITVKIDGQEFTVMKNAKTLETPTTYEATTVKINDFEIPAFYSEISRFTLVGVKDSKGDCFFAIYNEENNTYTLYNENNSNQLILYIQNITSEMDGFVKDKVTINEKTYDCFKSNDGSFVLVYAMNVANGEEGYYLYDSTENTFLKYNDSLIVSLTNEVNKYKMTILYMAAALIFLIIVIFGMLLKRSKKVKIVYTDQNTKQDQKTSEPKKEEPKKNSVKTEAQELVDQQLKKSTSKNTKNKKKQPSKETALEQMNKASEIIEKYEKTVKASQKEMTKKPKEEPTEETMYDIFEDERKKSSKKKKKKK